MSIIQGTSKSSAAAAGYSIEQSIRFNDDDSAYLSRTPGSAGNRKTWTFSSWVKRANLFNGSVPQIIFSAANGSTLDFIMQFGQSDDTLRISDYSSGSASNLITTQLFRDPSAWYHFVLQYDTTQATSSDRMKLYVNGTQVTAFSTASYPSLNYDSAVNNNLAHNISRGAYSANGYFDGYQAEINFIDGTALDPTSFGETNADTGQWVPVKYAGSYGTNGFYITGANSADLGADDSGNGNNFTSSGLAAADQVSDSPTDNFATFNSISGGVNQATLSDGNLTATRSSGTGIERSTITVPATGNWYAEFTIDSTGSGSLLWSVGVIKDDDPGLYQTTESRLGNEAEGYAYATNWSSTPVPHKSNNGTRVSYGTAGSNGDVIGVQLNNGSLTFYHNNTSQGEAYSGLSGDFLFGWSGQGSATVTANFGQSGFTYTPPTGAVALSTANLDDPTIALPEKYFNTVLYEGNGDGQRVGGFQPITETYTVPNSYL
jgi:hypothetical protein